MHNKQRSITELAAIADHFVVPGTLVAGEAFGNGHINSTYRLVFSEGDKPSTQYVLQLINAHVFQNYQSVQHNISLVTNFLRAQILAAGGDSLRETLTLIPTKTGGNYVLHEGEVYRMYLFIENTTCYERATPTLLYHAAKAFGKFARQLDGFDATQLQTTIDKFHDTVHRYGTFQNSIAADSAHRAGECTAEIAFVNDRKAFCSIVLDEIEAGTVPLRVCHNDTKLTNVMMDNTTNQGICVIDLDTVMQGSLLYDFGDSIRFGASSAAEDEEDLSRVYCDLEKYELSAKGYLEECACILSEKEFALLAHSAILLTLECGMRFLTDYLDGDVYFGVHKPKHNLIRARNQFKLVQDMEAKLGEMIAINEKYKQ